MRWCQQVPSTHQFPSIMEKLCLPILPRPITVRMHIKLPFFPGLWLHLHLSGIPLFPIFSSSFLPSMCPPSCYPPQFCMVTCLYLSSGFGSDVGGLPSSLVPPYYSYCLFPSYYLVFLGLRLAMKLEVPLMFWVLPWIFV